MSLKKQVLVKATGVPAGFHTVSNVTLDKLSSKISIAVQSYYSQESYNAGAMIVASVTIVLDGLPEVGRDVWAYADARLAAPVPPGGDDTAEIVQFAAQNPYAFAGATIV
jgi:hypothetical protein